MQTERVGRLVGGTTLIGAGLAATVIPLVPGFLLVGAGLSVLAPVVPSAQRAIDRIRSVYQPAE